MKRGGFGVTTKSAFGSCGVRIKADVIAERVPSRRRVFTSCLCFDVTTFGLRIDNVVTTSDLSVDNGVTAFCLRIDSVVTTSGLRIDNGVTTSGFRIDNDVTSFDLRIDNFVTTSGF